MSIKVQIRRGNASAWGTANPTLASGEIGYETDTKKMKVGDGVTAWSSLSYFPNATAVPFSPTGNISATNIAAALSELDTEKTSTSHDHTSGAGGTIAHSSLTGVGTTSASDIHHAIGTSSVDSAAGNHNHTSGAGGSIAASSISFTPTGSIASTTVQTAIAEAASEAVQSATHIDTDSATTSLHHTLGTTATQAAAGNHGHTSYMPVVYTTADVTANSTTQVDTSLSFSYTNGQIITANYLLPVYNATLSNFRFAWSFTNASLVWANLDYTLGTAVVNNTAIVPSSAIPVSSTTTPVWMPIRLFGSASGSGTATLRIASSANTNVGLKKGAWMQYIVQ